MNQDWQNKKNDLEKKLGHKIGPSRRELLASGLYSFSAGLAMPSLLTLLSRAAFAAEKGEKCLVAAPSDLPFLCFDMSGGAALSGNFLVGKAGGPDDHLASYSTLGWKPTSANIDRRFGLPMAGNNISGLLLGMTQAMSPEAQQRLRLGSVCHFSALDSSDNKQNAASLATLLGCKGRVFTTGLGSVRTPSGGASQSVMSDVAYSPIFFGNLEQLKASLRFGGPILASLSRDQLQKLTLTLDQLNVEQVDFLQTQTGGNLLKARVQEYLNEPRLDQLEIDPRRNPVAKQVWSIAEGTNPASDAVIQSAICTNVIDGVSGPGVWTLGGCDYHDSTSTTGDEKDLEMGLAIGRAVEYAHLMGKPLFFQLVSDGSCDSRPDTRYWIGDTNEGMQIFGYYRPCGAPEYLKDNMQIGHFNDAQSAERSTLVGADPSRAAMAVFANYCNILGRRDEFRDIAKVFSPQEINSLLVFAEG